MKWGFQHTSAAAHVTMATVFLNLELRIVVCIIPTISGIIISNH